MPRVCSAPPKFDSCREWAQIAPMFPDLTQFEGLQPSQIIRALRDMGYEDIGSGRHNLVMARPGDDHVIRLSNFVTQARAFADLCRAHEDSTYFPAVYDSYEVAGDPPFFLTVAERLYSVADLPEELHAVLGGGARALGLLIYGHESHDQAHEMMLSDDRVSSAVLAIIGKAEEILDSGAPSVLTIDGECVDLPDDQVDNWYPENVMFRMENGRCRNFVFSDPFGEAFIGNDKQRQKMRGDLKALRARIESMMPQKESPAAAPQGPCYSL